MINDRQNAWIAIGGATLIVLTFVVFYLVWMASSTLKSEFLSAIAGALVGGIVTWLVQLVSMRAAQKDREENRMEIRRALGYALTFKMMRIYSNLTNLRRHIEDCFQGARERSFNGEPWQIVLPLANYPSYVHFNPEEMSLILSLGESDLLNSLLSMDVIHNSNIDILEKLGQLREQLTSQLPAQMVGNVGSSYLTNEENLRLRPRMIEINMIIESIRPHLNRDADNANTVLARLDAALRVQLGFRHRIEGQPQ